jgi:glycosyltransferase involved in cell wall biosynthesis
VKIAQVAPLCESVPPKLYGGTERVVSYLTEALVELGHEVTLYASADSVTHAKLRPACRTALRLDKNSVDPVADHVRLAEQITREADEFEFVHSHIDYIGFPALRRIATPRVTTLHGRLDIPNLYNLFREFIDEPVISISRYQRLPLSWANWQTTIYHGLPKTLYTLQEKSSQYLAFLGRISPEKRVDRAIDITLRTGRRLKIAAKVDKQDREYYEQQIKPRLGSRDIEFIGEIGEHEKNDFLGNASALLFPIDWPEPFGLVMIEAMACGTPVIAFANGSVPELVEDGLTGFKVRDIEQAARAVANLDKIDRTACRRRFEQRFTAENMARNYLKVYQQLIDTGMMKQSGAETLSAS